MHTDPNFLIFVRGASGTGKSTFAQKLSNTLSDDILSYTVRCFSADDYFTHPDGTYHWDRNKLQEAHRLSQFRASEQLGFDRSIVIVHNTALKMYEAMPYVCAAAASHSRILDVFLEADTADVNFQRNAHGVDLETIMRMHTTGKEEYDRFVSQLPLSTLGTWRVNTTDFTDTQYKHTLNEMCTFVKNCIARYRRESVRDPHA